MVTEMKIISLGRELMNTFNQLCQQADLTKEQLETMLSQLDAQLMYLDRVAGQAKNFVLVPFILLLILVRVTSLSCEVP